jgi:hypothetical protein
MKPTDPGYAEALDQMEAAEAAERTEGRPCEPCPWVSTDPRDKEITSKPPFRTQMEMGGWFCCHVNMGTCYGARLMHEKHLRKQAKEKEQSP